MGLELNTLMF